MYEMGSIGDNCKAKKTNALIKSIMGIMISSRFIKYLNKALHPFCKNIGIDPSKSIPA